MKRYKIVKSFPFGEITKVHFQFVLSFTIFDAVIKPLNMAFGVWIHLQEKIELVLLYFNCAVQVATLEQTIKHPFSLTQIGIHAFESSVKESRTIVTIALELLLNQIRLDESFRFDFVPVHFNILSQSPTLMRILLGIWIFFVKSDGVMRPGSQIVNSVCMIIIKFCEFFGEDVNR